ncbi:MAG: ATP synthase F1 subunit delta [Polyangiales bacterium]
MIGGQIARRYAKALIELGTEQGTLDALVREITAVAEAFDSSAELKGLVDNPEVPRASRKAVLVEIATRLGASPVTRNTLSLLADNGRLRILPALARVLRDMADLRAGLVRAHVRSAAPLSEGYLHKLQQALEARFKKKVVIDREVDPKLLAGVVTRVGDTIIDGSLRSRLDELRTQLLPS